MKLCTLRTAFS